MASKEKTPAQFVAAFAKHGSIRAVSREWRVSYRQAHNRYKLAVAQGLMDAQRVGRKSNEEVKSPRLTQGDLTGRLNGRRRIKLPSPKEGEVRRFIFTCAQNNTRVCVPFWRNLQALSAHYSAEIHVSRSIYMRGGMGALGDKARVTSRAELQSDVWWDDAVLPHLSDEQAQVAPGLVWCGESNTLPTARRPLSQVATYTRGESGIFPHVKVAMETIPTAKSDPDKFNYTTGGCTLLNYIQRRAGIEAEFHHVYGALLVEVCDDGVWFARQLNANAQGTICDLDVTVKGGRVTTGNRIEALTAGDIHVEQVDPDVDAATWGAGGIVDSLRPKKQFAHDLLDFNRRNHHEIRNFHGRQRSWARGRESVEGEVADTFNFLKGMTRPWCKTVVVASNHDDFLPRWLRAEDYREDPVNAEFFLKCQYETVKAINRGTINFCVFEWLADAYFDANTRKRLHFLREDEASLVLGVECGMHGHLGPNGSRGSLRGFARTGRRANIGHTHTAGIFDGVYGAGTSSKRDLGYNKGPSSWSHSHVVNYANAKRAIVTLRGGRWRAPPPSS